MDFSLVIPALLFGAVGLFLVCFSLWVLWSAIFTNTRGWGERARFRRRQEALRKADSAIASKDFVAALGFIETSVYLDHLKSDLSLIEKVIGHHMGVLDRLLSVADELDQSLSNLAIIEDLVQQRGEMLRAYVEANEARQTLLRNRKKPVPRWALDEYERKIAEIADRLATNRRSLDSQFSSAVKDLRAPAAKHVEPSTKQELTIH